MKNYKSTAVLRNFRYVAIAEGISYIILVFIAMPLKYLADFPEMVTYVGWAHGALFVAFVALLALSQILYRWSFLKFSLAFISSLIPFGTFILDKHLKEDERKLAEA